LTNGQTLLVPEKNGGRNGRDFYQWAKQNTNNVKRDQKELNEVLLVRYA
jgi:hypothetical protein